MKYFIVTLLCFFQGHAFSQQNTSDELPDDNQLFVVEEQLQYKPTLNLNKANSIDLLATQLLNKEQVNTILNHRKRYGKFISLYELQVLSSISMDTLKLLSQYLYIPFFDVHNKQEILKEGSHYSLLRWERKIQTSKGYQINSKGIKTYQGEDYRLLYRFRSTASNLYYFGFSLEKDAGEFFVWQPEKNQFYFDYASAYLIFTPKKKLEQIAFGDFHFRSGHGLIFGGNFMQSKNPEYWQSAWQMGNGFRPHTSSSEYGFYRGIGLKMQSKHWGCSGLYSLSPQDGTLHDDQTLSALNTSGLHRSTTEQEKRNNTQLQQTGGTISFQNTSQSLRLGAEYLYSQYQYPFHPTPTYYNSNAFRGTAHQALGFDAQYTYHGGVCFAEFAKSSQKGKAFYAGILHNLSKQNTWMLQCWSANASFESLQGNIPSYSSGIGNETGLYQALLMQLSPKLKLSTGFSVYTNPQAAFGKKGPSYGHEWINRLTYTLKKKTLLFIQFRKIQQEETTVHRTITPQNKYYLMGDLVQKENIQWELHSRVQVGLFDLGYRETSYCMSQSIGYRFKKFTIKAQLSIFDSPSWDSRLYAYEPDVPLAFSIPALSGNGIRMCLVATVKPFAKTELSFKIAHVEYTHAKSIGSGYDEVVGNQQTELKVQGRIFL